jgi:hypothetical protein
MASTVLPELVGRYFVDTQPHFLPLSTREITRAAEFLGTVLDTYQFAPGRAVLLVCQFEEAAQFLPLEEALTDRGLILANAEASLYDGGRAESILRRFDICAVIGLNAPLLDSMEGLNVDVEKALAGKVVWARPCAYDRLSGMRGFTLRRYLEVGPTLGLECVHGGGAHVDAREWSLSERGGEVRVTNRLMRALPLQDAETGLRAAVDRSICDCGLADARIVPQRS